MDSTGDMMNFTDTILNATASSDLDKSTTPIVPDRFRISWDDATWVLTSAFIIFTMQSGESVAMDKDVVIAIDGCLGYY